MRVLMITQKLDPDDPVLAFTVDWVRGLATRLAHLHVLSLEQNINPEVLPANVTAWSMGKENGKNRLHELIAFYRALNAVIGQVDIIFCHMVPRYALLALPLAQVQHKPVGLWYAHAKIGTELRLVVPHLTWIATSVSTAFPLPGPKVHVLGQGINFNRYSPDATPKDSPPIIVSVGRLSPVKGYETLLEAAAVLRAQYPDLACRFVVAGGDVPNAPGHGDFLLKKREALGLASDYFQFVGSLTADEVVKLYQRSTLSVNLTPLGSFDKAGLEAMMMEIPMLALNEAFAPVWGDYADLLRLDREPAAIAQKIAALLSMGPDQREQIGVMLRQRTIELHSLDGLMDRLVNLMGKSL